jgi:hypothetical protein
MENSVFPRIVLLWRTTVERDIAIENCKGIHLRFLDRSPL